MKNLQDKVAVVTGAGSGIGRALATALAREGARLALSDIDERGLAETVGLLAPGTDVRTYTLDVSSEQAVFALYQVVGEFLDDIADVAEFDQSYDVAMEAEHTVHTGKVPVRQPLVERELGDLWVIGRACQLHSHRESVRRLWARLLKSQRCRPIKWP